MNTADILDSVRIQDHVAVCPQCRSTSRVGRGLCLNCLLRRGLGPDTESTETLANALDEVDVRDADWRIGNYQILEEIGRGGMGVIYRARQRHSRRIVALKRISSFHADSRETLARFRREAEAAASLDHPNILPIYEVNETEDGLPFFSMKFAAGGSLLDSARNLRNNPRQIVRLISKVARAVHHAHSQGILHRDLKPGNILLDSRGEPLVSDFGLAKWLDTNSDLTRTLTIFGTPGYIAPEQAQGPAKNLSTAADIYSIGAVLFDLFTGRPPFLGEHALAVIKQAADKPAPKLRTLAPAADRDLETICARCLEREPAARYRSAGDLAEDLERWLEGRPIIARPVSSPVRIWRWSKRNPIVAGFAAGCILLGAVVLAEVMTGSHLGNALRKLQTASRSTAIAPIEDLDELTTQSGRATAVSEALFSRLAREKKIQVSSTVGAFPLEIDPWRNEDWQTVGKKMHSRTIVSGSIRSRLSKIRLVIRLIDTVSGAVLARDVREAESLNEAVEAAAANLVAQLDALPNLSSPANLADDTAANTAATEYLRAGREYFFRYRPDDVKMAIDCLVKAIEADPKSSAAQAMYSLACLQHAQQAVDDSPASWRERARTAADTAIRLDPNLAVAQRARSCIAADQGLYAEAIEAGLCATELDPTEQRSAGMVAMAFMNQGRPDKAVPWYQRVVARSQRPGLNSAQLGNAFCKLEEDAKAEAAFHNFEKFFPDLPDAAVGVARLRVLQRNFDAARMEYQHALVRFPNHPYSKQMAAEVEFFARNFIAAKRLYEELLASDRYGGGWFYGCVSNLSALGCIEERSGNHAAADRLLNEALRFETENLTKKPGNSDSFYQLAAIQAIKGDKQSSLANLERAVSCGWIEERSLELDPRFESVASNSHFKELLRDLTAKVADLRQHAAKQSKQPK